MRITILVLCAVQFAAAIYIIVAALLTNSDAAGNAMSYGFAVAAGGLAAILPLPAFLLALAGRALKFALVLALAFPAFALGLVVVASV